MSLLSSFFGSPGDAYSTVEYELTEHELKLAVNHERIAVLDNSQAEKIRAAILARRRGDGKISLRQIYELLTHMVNTHDISTFDRKDTMKALRVLFEEKSHQHL